MWSIIEPSLGIVAGCLPTIYSLYLVFIQRKAKGVSVQPKVYKTVEVEVNVMERSPMEKLDVGIYNSDINIYKSGIWTECYSPQTITPDRLNN